FDYVLGDCQLAEAVRQTPFPGLDLLPVFDAAVDRIGMPSGSGPAAARARSRALAAGFHARFAGCLAERSQGEPELALARRVAGSRSGRKHGAVVSDSEWT